MKEFKPDSKTKAERKKTMDALSESRAILNILKDVLKLAEAQNNEELINKLKESISQQERKIQQIILNNFSATDQIQ